MEKDHIYFKLQTMIGSTCNKWSLQMVSKSNSISNFPVLPTYITNSRAIYVPDLAGVEGKMWGRKILW